ncbi:hypothetical protein [Haloquadratum walsbyi]|nr:hypothetical protein [Haloquadratum walsbyi]
MSSARLDFPDPDSPTIPSTSPASTVKLMFAHAMTVSQTGQ